MVDAVVAAPNLHAVHVDRRRLHAEPVVHFPDFHIADDEGVQPVRAEAVHALAEVEAVAAVAVRFVVIEAHERQHAQIELPAFAIGQQNRLRGLHRGGIGRFEAVTG